MKLSGIQLLAKSGVLLQGDHERHSDQSVIEKILIGLYTEFLT